jgi:hypothetical protein
MNLLSFNGIEPNTFTVHKFTLSTFLSESILSLIVVCLSHRRGREAVSSLLLHQSEARQRSRACLEAGHALSGGDDGLYLLHHLDQTPSLVRLPTHFS